MQNGLNREEDKGDKIIKLYKRHVAVYPELKVIPYF